MSPRPGLIPVETPPRAGTERNGHATMPDDQLGPGPRARRGRAGLSRAGRPVRPRAARALLSHAGFDHRRRGRAPGDSGRSLARTRRLRRPGVASRLALPHRDEPLPERDPRREATSVRAADPAVRAAGAVTARRGDVAPALPRQLARPAPCVAPEPARSPSRGTTSSSRSSPRCSASGLGRPRRSCWWTSSASRCTKWPR